MQIACDGETVYGLVDTYKTKKEFIKRFYRKYKNENIYIDSEYGIETVMMKKLTGGKASNYECGLYEREDGNIPAFKCHICYRE